VITSSITKGSGQEPCIKMINILGGKKQNRTSGDFGRMDDSIQMDLKTTKV
jgi:hypothetical protein